MGGKNRWVTGGRGGGPVVETKNMLGSNYEMDSMGHYQWFAYASMDDRDKKKGKCIRYGDGKSILPSSIGPQATSNPG